MADNNNQKLFADFPAISTEQWLKQIETDLKGADFEKRLVWKTSEGFKVQPFYRHEDTDSLPSIHALPNEFPYLRGVQTTGNDWLVRQRIVVSDVKTANIKANDLLTKGINSITFSIKKELVTCNDLTALLTGLCPKTVELNFETCLRSTAELAKLVVGIYKMGRNEWLRWRPS